MTTILRANVCTCEPSDPGGVDPGCVLHGSHPCPNGARAPHPAGKWGHGCCAHCIHFEPGLEAVNGGQLSTAVRLTPARVSPTGHKASGGAGANGEMVPERVTWDGDPKP